MKKTLLFVAVFFVALSVRSEIVYTDFADGWRIDLNENVAMDLDEDGVIDFYINGHDDEIGFVPVFGQGCFASPDGYVINNIGSRQLGIYEEGDFLQLNSGNLYDYIDDDRGSMYSIGQGFADDWEDMEYQYVGFVVIIPGGSGTWDGWMQVAVDKTNEQMIIKGMAYETEGDMLGGGPGINAGDTGASAISNLDKQIGELVISPNPTSDVFNLQFDYAGNAELAIAVLNNVGQVVHREQNAIARKNSLTISTSDWSAGTYFIRLSSEEGVSAKRVMVVK